MKIAYSATAISSPVERSESGATPAQKHNPGLASAAPGYVFTECRT